MTSLCQPAAACSLRAAAVLLALLLTIYAQPARSAPPLVHVEIVPWFEGRTAPSLQVFFITDGTSVQCSVDGQPASACTSPVVLQLPEGPHSFLAIATNETGETGSAVVNFFVDASAPTLTDVSPQGLNPPSVTAFFSSSDTEAAGTRFECMFDGQQYTPCSPGVPVVFSSLFDGPHELRIVATDAVGNSAQFVSPFLVDGRGPVFDPERTRVPAAAACPRSTSDTQIVFFAEDERRSDPVTYRCSLDGAAPGACISGNAADPRFNWRCLAPGQHLLTVQAFDRFQNPSDPLELAFSVERAATCPINACAGPDRSANEQGNAVLDGTQSTGDFFSWRQIAGPSVGNFDLASPTPAITAPALAGRAGSQLLTFQLTMTSASSPESDSDTVDVVVRNGNLAPVADAGADQAVREASPVVLSGVLSYDPDGDALSAHEWVQVEGAPVALHNATTAQATFTAPLLAGGLGGPQLLRFQLRVFDDALFSAPDEVSVLVEQLNHAPVADAGPDQTKVEGTSVSLAGSGTDADADPLSYSWMQISGTPVVLANADTPIASFTAPAAGAAGTALGFRLTVTDGSLQGADEVVVNVRRPNDPPNCNLARASSPYLWPPNHKLVPVTIAGVTDPDSPSLSIAITGVMQDEPVDGTGGGDTAPDAVIQGSLAMLRAERDGAGNGRVYRVAFTADDGQGGSCAGAVDVVVPHNARATLVPNDGVTFDSTGR